MACNEFYIHVKLSASIGNVDNDLDPLKDNSHADYSLLISDKEVAFGVVDYYPKIPCI